MRLFKICAIITNIYYERMMAVTDQMLIQVAANFEEIGGDAKDGTTVGRQIYQGDRQACI